MYGLSDRDAIFYTNIIIIPAKETTELRNYIFKYFVYTYSGDRKSRRRRRSHTSIKKLNLTAKKRIQ